MVYTPTVCFRFGFEIWSWKNQNKKPKDKRQKINIKKKLKQKIQTNQKIGKQWVAKNKNKDVKIK